MESFDLDIMATLNDFKLDIPDAGRLVDTIHALFISLRTRDVATAEHSLTMAEYTYKLAKLCDSNQAEMYFMGGLMHDIGKLAMDDVILKGDIRLNDKQRHILKQHVQDGVAVLSELSMPQLIIDIAHYHHERFNGSGYLEGLQGEDIPLCGRITALTDTYSALIASRPYQPQRTPNEALKIITDCYESFDPFILPKFNDLVLYEITNVLK
jgi:putative two-component system response regulator